MGAVRVPVLSREGRLDLAKVPRGPAWALPLGMPFAAGWTPCIGPILATILVTAAATRTACGGGALPVAYSAGLAVPFARLAVRFTRARAGAGDGRRRPSGARRLAGPVGDGERLRQLGRPLPEGNARAGPLGRCPPRAAWPGHPRGGLPGRRRVGPRLHPRPRCHVAAP